MPRLKFAPVISILRYSLGASLLICALGISGASYLFLHLANHQRQLHDLLETHSGWDLNISHIHSNFNHAWQPSLQLDNLSLRAATESQLLIEIKHLDLIFSYQSLYQLQPIFSLINLDGSQLNLAYRPNSDLVLNNHILANLAKTSNTTFNWQNLLLSQKTLKLSHLDLSYSDTKHHLAPLRLNLTLTSQIHHGAVEFIHATVAANPVTNQDRDDHMDCSGTLVIESSARGYKIRATNLKLNSASGYLLNGVNIQGNYLPTESSQLKVSNLNFSNLSNLIHYLQLSTNFSLSGTIDSLNLKWRGAITQIHDLSLASRFSDLAISRVESSIPELNHISGQLLATESSGHLSLELKNSQLRYPQQLRHTVLIGQLATVLNWQQESAQLSKLTWTATSIRTKDLQLTSSGSYTRLPESVSVVAQLSRFDLAQLTTYLPKATPAAAVDYLQHSRLKGSLTNGRLNLSGNPQQIPFQHGGGKLNFSAQLNQVQFKFSPQWGLLSKANGSLKLGNQQLSLHLDSGTLANNTLRPSQITLNDISNPILNIQAQLVGLTANYVSYLQDSPLQPQIPQSLKHVQGSSQIDLNLRLPLQQPEQLKLAGSLSLQQNSWHQPPLALSNINGALKFSQAGLAKSNLSATAFDSKLDLNIFNNHEMQLTSADLNYSALMSLVAPTANQVLYGRAPTQISYNSRTANLLIQSNLYGVTIAAPLPLAKSATESQELQIHMQPGAKNTQQITLNYADRVIATASLKPQLQLQQLHLTLGTQQPSPDSCLTEYHAAAPITIQANLESIPILEWITMLRKLAPQSEAPATTAATTSLYPIKVALSSNGFWLGNYNLDRGSLNMEIESTGLSAAMETPDIQGEVRYQRESNQVTLKLAKLLFSSSNFQLPESAHSTPQGATSTADVSPPESAVALDTSITLPQINLEIANLYYQNHYLGNLRGNISQESQNRSCHGVNCGPSSVYLESGELSNKAALTTFSLSDQCVNCGADQETVALLLRSDINNFGLLLKKLDLGDSFSHGTGNLELALNYHGGLNNFNYQKTTAKADLTIANIELTHVKPGFFGALLGVVTLKTAFTGVNTLTTFATTGKVNMNALFSNNLTFKSLTSTLKVNHSDVTIQNLTMDGGMLKLYTFGHLYLESNTIDSYLTVEPKVSTTVATTIGIVTLNPVLGFVVYFANQLLGNPENKALAVSYHIHGDVESPTMTKTTISNQLIQNVGTSLNVFQH